MDLVINLMNKIQLAPLESLKYDKITSKLIPAKSIKAVAFEHQIVCKQVRKKSLSIVESRGFLSLSLCKHCFISISNAITLTV